MLGHRYSEADLLAMLPLYLDGELDDEERSAVEAYLADHPEVLARFGTSARLIDLLEEAIAPHPVDERFVDDVMAQVEHLTPLRRWWARQTLLPPLLAVRWAAEAIILVFLALLLVLHPWAPTINPVECQLLGDARWAVGAPSAARVIVRRRTDQAPLVNAEVVLRLQRERWRTVLRRARTNDQGTLDVELRLGPELPPGGYVLVAEAQTAQGTAVAWSPVTLVSRTTVDLHLPADALPAGQTLRAGLAARGGDDRPLAGATADWRLDDARGRRLAGGSVSLSPYGQALLEAPTSAFLTPGAATLWARVGDAVASRPVRLDPPGDELAVRLTPSPTYGVSGRAATGEVQATGPVGEPVAGAAVAVNLAVEGRAATWRGMTDGQGRALWQVTVPPAPDRPTAAMLSVSLSDSRGRTGRARRALPVDRQPLRLDARPTGRLVAGLDNHLPVTVLAPDGTLPRPDTEAWASVAGGADQVVPLDHGSGILTVRPAAGLLTVELRARAGREVVARTISLNVARPEESLLVQPAHLRLRAGQPVRVTVVSPGRLRAAYLDLVSRGRTIATRSLGLDGRQGALVLHPSPEISGELLLRAYARQGRRWRTGWARVWLDAAENATWDLTPDPDSPGWVTAGAAAAGAPPTAEAIFVGAAGPTLAPHPESAADAGPPPGFSLLANSVNLARQQALAAQSRFFRHSPLYGGLAGGLVLWWLLVWLYQFLTDPYEYVRPDERRRWGRVPQVHRRGAWAGFGALLAGLVLAGAVTSAVVVAGWQARDLEARAIGPLIGWDPRPDGLARQAVAAVPALLRAAEPGQGWEGTPDAVSTSLLATDAAGRVRWSPSEALAGSWSVSVSGLSAEGPLAPAVLPVHTPGRPTLSLEAPARLVRGDVVALPVRLTNPLDRPVAFGVTFSLDGALDVLGARQQQVTLPPHSEAQVGLPVRATDLGTAAVKLEAVGADTTLTAQAELVLAPPAERVLLTTLGRVGGRTDVDVDLPTGAVTRAVEVRVEDEPLYFQDLALARAAEQPVTTGRDAFGALDAEALRWRLWTDAQRLDADRQAALRPRLLRAWQRLLAYEAAGGGFAPQPGAAPDLALTAQAAITLERAPVEVADSSVLRRTTSWLLAHLPAGTSTSQEATALVVAALAGRTDDARVPALAASLKPDQPDLAVRVAVARALERARDPRLDAVLQALAEARYARADGSNWYSPGPTASGATGRGATLEATAEAVACLARSGRPDLRGAWHDGARFLQHRLEVDSTWGGAWLTAAVVRALAAAEPPPQPARGLLIVETDGHAVDRVPLDWARHSYRRTLTPDPGTHRVTLRYFGRGQPSFRVSAGGAPLRPTETGPLRAAAALDRTTVAAGTTATLAITVTNAGPTPAAGVVAVLPVPAGFSVRRGRDVVLTDGVARLPVGQLAPGQTATVQVQLDAVAPSARVAPVDGLVQSLYSPDLQAHFRLPRLAIP